MFKWFRNYRAAAQTRHELSRLTSRELLDIGLNAGDIDRIVMEVRNA